MVTATLASIGTAGVPGVGLIMLAMVLRQVGLPVESWQDVTTGVEGELAGEWRPKELG